MVQSQGHYAICDIRLCESVDTHGWKTLYLCVKDGFVSIGYRKVSTKECIIMNYGQGFNDKLRRYS